MRRAKSKHPVGATWEGTGKNYRGIELKARIWLEERKEHLEVWKWYTKYSDGSSSDGDWNTSYKNCREEIPLTNLRMKRIK